MPRVDSSVKLKDGRTAAVAEFGPPDGVPIVHCHGNGTSRLEPLVLEARAESASVRLIAIDRPGIGGSSQRPGYRLLDWPDDLVEVADQIGLDRFAVEGMSGGAPFALACACKIPQRLTKCGLISPATGPFLSKVASPGMRAALWTLLHFPGPMAGLMRFSTRFTGTDQAGLEKTLLRNADRLGPADRELLGDPLVRRAFARATAEGYRQGADAPTRDGIVFGGTWGFQAGDVSFENIYLWQGEQDRVMPPAAARLLTEALPHCTSTYYPGDGHLSTLVNHAPEIWQTLAS